jgi:hypothetical protein
LPYAKAPFVCAHPDRSQASSTRPEIKLCAGAAASTASHPNVRDDGQRPSSGRDSESYSLVFISEKQKYFCKRDWTADLQTAALICPSGNQRAIPGRNSGDRSPVRAEEFQRLLSRWEAASAGRRLSILVVFLVVVVLHSACLLGGFFSRFLSFDSCLQRKVCSFAVVDKIFRLDRES